MDAGEGESEAKTDFVLLSYSQRKRNLWCVRDVRARLHYHYGNGENYA